MGSNWKRIPENLTPEEFIQVFAQQFNQWAVDKDRFESSVTTPRSKRSAGSSIALTREETVDITRVGNLAGVSGSIADEPFVTVSNSANLNAERQLLVADPLNKTDSGANGNLTLGVSYTTPNISLGTAAVEGTNARPIRSDSTIVAFDGVTPQGVSTSASTGTNAFAARSNHVHAIGADVAVVSKLTGASNSSTFTLFDTDGTSQTLVGNLGNLNISGASSIDFKKAIRVPVQANAFGYSSPYVSIVMDSAATGSGMFVTRANSANEPFLSFSGYDDATDRRLYFGGGGWGSTDATSIQFYVDETYDETLNGGTLAFEIGGVNTQPRAEHDRALSCSANIVPRTNLSASLGSVGPPAGLQRRFANVCGESSYSGEIFLEDDSSANWINISADSSTPLSANTKLKIDLENAEKYAVTVGSNLGTENVNTDRLARWVSSAGPRIEGSNVTLNNLGTVDRLELDNATTAGASLRIPAGTAPTTPAEGDYWNDSARATEIAHFSGINNYRYGGLYVSTADAMADALTEETLIGSGIGTLTLPAGFFKVGKSIFIKASGTVFNGDSGGVLTVRLKLGSTVIVTTMSSGLQLSGMWEYQAMVTCRTAGAPGTVMAQGRMLMNEITGIAVTNLTTDRGYDANSTSIDELADVVGTAFADLIHAEEFSGEDNTTTSNITTSSSQVVDLVALWSDLADLPYITCTNFYLETGF